MNYLRAIFTLYWIAFRVSTKRYLVWNEQQRPPGTELEQVVCTHRTSCLSGSWTKSQFSLFNIYFRLSGFQSSLLFIHFRYGPNTCSDWAKMWHKACAICDTRLKRWTQRSFVTIQKSRGNQAWTDALSSMVSSRRKSYQAYCKRTLWPQKIKDHGIIFRAAYTFMAYIREYPPGSK